MTVFRALLRRLSGRPASPSRDIRRRLAAAYAKRDAAENRGDTRDYGRAIMELQQVRLEQLSGEVRR